MFKYPITQNDPDLCHVMPLAVSVCVCVWSVCGAPDGARGKEMSEPSSQAVSRPDNSGCRASGKGSGVPPDKAIKCELRPRSGS